MQGLAQRVFALRPDLINPDASYGELAWIWGKGHAAIGDAWRRRLWFADPDEGGGLVGWAWATMPHQARRTDGSVRTVGGASVAFQVHPERGELVDEIIAWFEGVAGDLDRHVIVTTTDKEMSGQWAAAGYEAGSEADGDWTRLNGRRLDDLAEPVLPEGYRFRTAAELSAEVVAQAHIDAWHPSLYSLEAYEGVRKTTSYRPDLHFLVEAPDGTMAASTIAWFDPANRTGEFEPVGTHPLYRRKGLSTAMLLHGMRVLRDAGAERMTVACLGAPGNPALGLYEGVGFREISRDIELVKRRAA
ncbi:MAG TPA: GNAT family N-acetyltransferase [Actinospica sp.]|nr:GNAT family N-acetyltransferase [Actinospica sp.]